MSVNDEDTTRMPNESSDWVTDADEVLKSPDPRVIIEGRQRKGPKKDRRPPRGRGSRYY